VLPVDLATNAESLGVRVLRADGVADLRAKLAEAKAHTGGPVLVHVETDPLVPAPDSESWWDVPVAEVSAVDSTRQARKAYEQSKANQRPYW
jgi:3D-(3,5/4)-trihydroxycyclohexane-1,2-dione acylhydrolase (decyclizing)